MSQMWMNSVGDLQDLIVELEYMIRRMTDNERTANMEEMRWLSKIQGLCQKLDKTLTESAVKMMTVRYYHDI